jgi:hypothetical protein
MVSKKVPLKPSQTAPVPAPCPSQQSSMETILRRQAEVNVLRPARDMSYAGAASYSMRLATR